MTTAVGLLNLNAKQVKTIKQKKLQKSFGANQNISKLVIYNNMTNNYG